MFSQEEHDRIKTAVAAAEAATAGEIAVMVVDRSERYREAEVLGSMLLALALAVLAELTIAAAIIHGVTGGWGSGASHLVVMVLSSASLWRCLPLAVLLYFVSRWLFRRWERLKLPFISPRRREEAVRDHAVRAFYERGLYKTRDETGVLIFISLLEHKVWILGDRGINRLIEPGQWQSLAAELANGLKTGTACTALCSVIGQCGALLARYFPRKHDDTNELADGVLH